MHGIALAVAVQIMYQVCDRGYYIEHHFKTRRINTLTYNQINRSYILHNYMPPDHQ